MGGVVVGSFQGWVGVGGGLHEQREEEEIRRAHKREIKGECD